MTDSRTGGQTDIRYQPDEKPPIPLVKSLGLQLAGLNIAAMSGLYDAQRITGAAWIDVPDIGWPRFDLDFGPAFTKELNHA